MPYIITFVWYPPSIIKRVVEKYFEATKKFPLPSNIKRLVLAATAASKEGMEVINVDEVKKEDLWEGTNYVGKFMLEFRDIEEVRYEVRIFSTLAEGLKDIGMG